MAELPKGYTRQDIYDILEAAQRFYPVEIQKIKGGVPASRWGKWSSRDTFFNEFKQLTGQSSIEGIYDQLQKWALEAPVKAEVEATTPQNLQELQQASAIREEARQKAITDANRKVKEEITRLQNTRQRLSAYEQQTKRQTRIYTKVTNPQIPQLSSETQGYYDSLKIKPKRNDQTIEQWRQENPSIPKITQEVEASISKTFPGIPEEQRRLIAMDAVSKGFYNANHPEEANTNATNTAILRSISTDNTVVPSIVTDKETLQDLRTGSAELGFFQDPAMARMIWNGFKPGLGDQLFPDPKLYGVEFLTQAQGANYSFAPDGMLHGYQEFLERNSTFFDQVSNFTLERFQHEITIKGLNGIESRLIQQFPEAAQFFSSPKTQFLMSSLGLGTTEIELSGPLAEYFVANYEALPVINFFSSGYGITFSVAGYMTGAEIATATAATATEISISGGIMASEAFLGGAGAAAATGTGAAAGAAAGTAVAPVIGTIAGAAIGFIGPKVIDKIKDFTSENQTGVATGIGALAGAGFAFATGAISIAYAAILGGAAAFGVTTFAVGGLPGIQASLLSFGSGVVAFIDVLWLTFLKGIATPILIFLFGFPLAVIFILFIINSGAYVVPPGAPQLNSTNPYISVEKVANPAGKLPSPTTITYTVTVAAKKDTLTDISVKADCHAQLKGGGTLTCPKEDIPAPPAAINAGSPWSFTFTSPYGNIYQDSLVANSITVSATSVEGGPVTETGSASVCFGDCPLDCFDLTDPSWNAVPSIQAQFTNAAALLAGKYSNFAAKVCAGGPVKLCYTTSDPAPGSCEGIYGRTVSNQPCNIYFNKCASQVGGQEGVNYILTHEATHQIQLNDSTWQNKFEEQVPRSEWPLCTYGGDNPAESMAEGDAMFVANPVIYANQCVSVSTFARVYPFHYKFARDVMFAP